MKALKQVGALAVRKADDGALNILLVTSRETGRWVIPKGWPSKRMKDPDAAAREAREEAGVSGKIGRKSIGFYRYFKREGKTAALVEVSVFMLKVRKERKTWDEQKERQRAWFEIDVAARRVREPRLKALILSLKTPKPGTAAKV